jgi:hypothetical protein
MLLAGVIQYFAAGYSPLTLPIQVPALVTAYLAPVVFVSGVGLMLYGFYVRAKS